MWAAKKIKTVSKLDDFGVKWQVYHYKSCDISHRGRVSLDADLPQQIQLKAAWWMCCFCGRTTILLSKRQYNPEHTGVQNDSCCVHVHGCPSARAD